MSIGILITNYNTWNLTSKSIESCLRFADLPIDKFVVVDDHSTEEFVNQFNEITLVRNSENLGLVRSLNLGLSHLNTDLIIIFDSDAGPLENYLQKTKQYFADNPQIGIAAYQTERADGQVADSFEPEPNAVSVILGQQLHTYYRKYFERKPASITVYTCAMVIRKEVLQDIGGFDENYDWLELDNDFCMRAIRRQWEIGVIPVRAYHLGSGTAQKVGDRVIRYYKNRVKLLRKFGKYPAADLLNLVVALRFCIEFAVIKTLGKLIYDADRLNDKTDSRLKLIKLFWSGNI